MLSAVFRAKMRDALAHAGLTTEIDPRVWERTWVVHVQQIGRGAHAMRYLARYVFRVALSNERLVRFADDRDTFRYVHAATHETRQQTLPVDRFLGQFLEHVLPRGFTKIRSYGLLSPTSRPALDRARAILEGHAAPLREPPVEEASATAIAVIAGLVPPPRPLGCPVCAHGALRLVERFTRPRAPP